MSSAFGAAALDDRRHVRELTASVILRSGTASSPFRDRSHTALRDRFCEVRSPRVWATTHFRKADLCPTLLLFDTQIRIDQVAIWRRTRVERAPTESCSRTTTRFGTPVAYVVRENHRSRQERQKANEQCLPPGHTRMRSRRRLGNSLVQQRNRDGYVPDSGLLRRRPFRCASC